VEFQSTASTTKQDLKEVPDVIENSRASQLIAAIVCVRVVVRLAAKSSIAEVLRFNQWRAASRRSPGFLSARAFRFRSGEPAGWRLHNACARNDIAPDATIVGCQ